MSFSNPWTHIAKAAKLRDWDAIDRQLEELQLASTGSIGGTGQAIRDGHRLADRELGKGRLPQLDRPDPVTMHDLPSMDGYKIEVSRSGINKLVAVKAA